MKKAILITALVVLALVVSLVAYFHIWGGEPYIEDFEEVSDDYEIVAQLALNSYNNLQYLSDLAEHHGDKEFAESIRSRFNSMLDVEE